jgi:hypothetical protein
MTHPQEATATEDQGLWTIARIQQTLTAEPLTAASSSTSPTPQLTRS